MAPSVEVQMQINLGGLDTVMAQMVLNIRDGMAAVKAYLLLDCAKL